MALPKYIKNTGLLIFSLILTLILSEIASRVFWHYWRGVSITNISSLPQAVVYSFYPNLQPIIETPIHKNDGFFDILILGGSVVNKWYGDIETHLGKQLRSLTTLPIRIHNVAFPGHSTRDSFNKYNLLHSKQFELVMIYHGINDIPTNNAPPDVFKEDYSHYFWYGGFNRLVADLEERIPLFALPLTIQFGLEKAKERLPLPGYIPRKHDHELRMAWFKYGSEVKSATPFRNNLAGILKATINRKEPVLLMTFAFYVPNNYSLEKFNSGSLDYSSDYDELEYSPGPIELWGIPENVIKALDIHNQIILDLTRKFNHVRLIDQRMLIPSEGKYFNDICHLSEAGIKKFVGNVVSSSIGIISSDYGY